MALALANITFDCADPLRVGNFWSAALGRPLTQDSPFFARIEGSPNWLFIAVPEPKVTKNRNHVDLQADDQASEVARLVGLGAALVAEKDEWGHRWTVMADPEGNEFCVS